MTNKDKKTENSSKSKLENKIKFNRILFKVSGEAMMGGKEFAHDKDAINNICDQIISACNKGCEVAVVVGGGNIFRGISASAQGMERVSADYMGMLATCINGLALQSALEAKGIDTRMLSAIAMNTVCEPYIKRRASRHLEKKRVVIFTAGTGNPFFTTDTAAILRAIEMNCDAILKGTQVDGVYCSDPKTNNKAVRYDKISYLDVIKQDLKVMDQTAITLAKDNKLPIIVFSIKKNNAIADVIDGNGPFTIIN